MFEIINVLAFQQKLCPEKAPGKMKENTAFQNWRKGEITKRLPSLLPEVVEDIKSLAYEAKFTARAI